MIASVKTIYTIIVDQVFQNFMFFFPRKERESFVRKVLVLFWVGETLFVFVILL